MFKCLVFCFSLHFITTHAVAKATELDEANALVQKGDFSSAFAKFKTLADDGVEIAQFTLAHMYEQGQGVSKSISKSCDYYLLAAQQGVPFALQKTADCYMAETLVPKNAKADKYAIAIDYYWQASESGILSASCKASEITMQQSKDASVIEQGLTTCLQVADQGSVSASLSVGVWFLVGQYVNQNLVLAEKYLMQSKPKNDPVAAYYLGRLYDLHIQATPKDDMLTIKTAIYWYETAASKGYADAYLPSALLYYKLSSVEGSKFNEHLAKAYLWSAAASKTVTTDSNSETKENINLLIKNLKDEIPKPWLSSLDQQVDEHIKKQHME